jgi:hypothetical protein
MGKMSIFGVLRLRATERFITSKCVMRSAQDDDFCGSLSEKHPKLNAP